MVTYLSTYLLLIFKHSISHEMKTHWYGICQPNLNWVDSSLLETIFSFGKKVFKCRRFELLTPKNSAGLIPVISMFRVPEFNYFDLKNV